MNSITEKEKKLNQTLEKLKSLDLVKKDNSPELENLKEQKNQLEIEYKQLLENYNFLEKENLKLKKAFEEFKSKDESENIRDQRFSEKIDELNQETDSLLDEIEKWQM
ncbi:MAG: 5-formyltetrahydrofolate cyclo-ligase [Candidatus Pelagibacter sp.]